MTLLLLPRGQFLNLRSKVLFVLKPIKMLIWGLVSHFSTDLLLSNLISWDLLLIKIKLFLFKIGIARALLIIFIFYFQTLLLKFFWILLVLNPDLIARWLPLPPHHLPLLLTPPPFFSFSISPHIFVTSHNLVLLGVKALGGGRGEDATREIGGDLSGGFWSVRWNGWVLGSWRCRFWHFQHRSTPSHRCSPLSPPTLIPKNSRAPLVRAHSSPPQKETLLILIISLS